MTLPSGKMLPLAVLVTVCALTLPTQVSYERILKAEDEPGNWMTYSGTYLSHYYSKLDQINTDSVKNLELKWVVQASSPDKLQSTPLVVDDVMYLTEGPNNVVSLYTETGRPFWTYRHALPTNVNVCCGRVNRGLAILDDVLYTGTLDGRLLALNRKTGEVLWDEKIVDNSKGYTLTMAPLVVKDKVIMGTAGGEYGIRGFLDAYDAKTGERAWRFYTVPGPGEPGHETWAGDSWKRGGVSAWLTGSFDPELNLLYWGIGNPSPDWNGDVREEDNLYTDGVIALNPDNGELKWHFQFTPHEVWDFDAVQIPVLVDRPFRGQHRKLMLWGNRNGFYYVLDRTSGEFLLGKQFARQDWALGLDQEGRPIRAPGKEPSPEGTVVYPAVRGATNGYAPSYSPTTGLFYLAVWDDYPGVYFKGDPTDTPGNRYPGSAPQNIYPTVVADKEPGYGAVRALDPETGERKWEFKTTEVSETGLLTTAGDVLFSGTIEGNFIALDARTGKLIWRAYLGGRMVNSPITYLSAGKQYVSVAAGHSLFTFGLSK